MVATAPELSVHSQGCVTQQNMKESCFRAGHGGWLTDGAIANCGTRALTTSGDELAVVWDMVKRQLPERPGRALRRSQICGPDPPWQVRLNLLFQNLC